MTHTRTPIDISPEFINLYQRYCNIGLNYLKKQNIIFVGLARDLEQTIESSVDKILKVSEFCKNIHICVVENDSLDGTKEKLSNIKIKYPDSFNYISNTYNLPKFGTVKDKARTIALADQRNLYLDYINSLTNKYDYVVVVDLDFQDFSINGFVNSFGWISEHNIDAMCGISLRYQHVFNNQQKNYWNYDCWAYRGNWWNDKQLEVNDCNSMLWFGFWIPPVGSSPIKINSGFGGMCIYKSIHLLNCKYEGYDCEHVCLHKTMYSTHPNFNLCINPSQIMLLL